MSGPAARDASGADVSRLLSEGRIEVVGRLRAASNVTLLVDVEAVGTTRRAVYKPVSGERPLWDFPDGTLAGREVAAHLVTTAAGCDAVPATVMREEAPFGPGSLQAWVDTDAPEPGDGLVDLFDPGAVPDGWRSVLSAQDARGAPVLLAHADTRGLRDVAVLDLVLNNADRKGGHLLVDTCGRVRGVDHGLTFHRDDKLRTVLWGWAGERLDERDRDLLDRLAAALDSGLGTALGPLLTSREVRALGERVAAVRRTGCFPRPDGSWPAIPWPAF
ncbi:MAG: SCO1664 family protein [Kineosporiaceae bacterium]